MSPGVSLEYTRWTERCCHILDIFHGQDGRTFNDRALAWLGRIGRICSRAYEVFYSTAPYEEKCEIMRELKSETDSYSLNIPAEVRPHRT